MSRELEVEILVFGARFLQRVGRFLVSIRSLQGFVASRSERDIGFDIRGIKLAVVVMVTHSGSGDGENRLPIRRSDPHLIMRVGKVGVELVSFSLHLLDPTGRFVVVRSFQNSAQMNAGSVGGLRGSPLRGPGALPLGGRSGVKGPAPLLGVAAVARIMFSHLVFVFCGSEEPTRRPILRLRRSLPIRREREFGPSLGKTAVTGRL